MTIEYLGIGTPEDALRSCLKLFSRLFEVPEAEVRGYLDMYYQLRLRAEEKTDCHAGAAAPVRNDGEDGGRQIAQTSLECRTLPARQNAPTEKAVVDAVSGRILSAPLPLDEDGGRQITAPTETTEVDPPPAAPVDTSSGLRPPSPQGEGKSAPSIAKKPRPGARGNDYAAKAAEFKREVREKLAAARAAGVTSGMILEKVKPGSALTERRLWDILNARLAPVEAYRVLDEVLDTLEAASKE